MKTALLTLTLLLSVSMAHATSSSIPNAPTAAADFSRDYQAPKGKTACGKSTDGTFGEGQQQLIHPAIYTTTPSKDAFSRSSNSII